MATRTTLRVGVRAPVLVQDDGTRSLLSAAGPIYPGQGSPLAAATVAVPSISVVT